MRAARAARSSRFYARSAVHHVSRPDPSAVPAGAHVGRPWTSADSHPVARWPARGQLPDRVRRARRRARGAGRLRRHRLLLSVRASSSPRSCAWSVRPRAPSTCRTSTCAACCASCRRSIWSSCSPCRSRSWVGCRAGSRRSRSSPSRCISSTTGSSGKAAMACRSARCRTGRSPSRNISTCSSRCSTLPRAGGWRGPRRPKCSGPCAR